MTAQVFETNYSVATVAQLAAAISAIDAAAASGNATAVSSITFTADIGTADDPLGNLADIDLRGATHLVIDGGGHMLNGGANARGFVVTSGGVSITGLTMADLVAQGANGGLRGTGGDAGLGGALFVGADAIVSLSNDIFTENYAIGGDGALVDYSGSVAAGSEQSTPAAAGFGKGGMGASEEITTDNATGLSNTRVGVGGAAGFGGGGGAGIAAGAAGFGGGNGWSGGDTGESGGGGLGAGGDIFVQSGGQLAISSGSLTAGLIYGGSSGANQPGYNGAAFGATIFAQDGVIHLTPGVGQTVALAGGIADSAGSGGSGADLTSASLQVYGAGVAFLGGDDTYSGGTTIGQGTLVLGSALAAGSGDITFVNNARVSASLSFDHANGLPNAIDRFGAGDSIVVGDQTIQSFSYAGNVLTLTYASNQSDQLTLNGAYTSADFILSDAHTIGSSATQIVHPSIVSVAASAAGPIVGAGGTVQFTLTASVPDLLISLSGGVPVLRLSDGLNATFVSSSGDTLLFAYTASSGDRSADLKVIGLDLGGAQVSDPGGISLSVAGIAGLAGADSGTAVRAAGPVVTSVNATPDIAGPLDAGHVVRFGLSTDVPITIDASGGEPTLSLSNGASATYDAGSGQFVYTVAAGDDTGDLTVTAIVPNGATLQDALGNGLDLVSFDAASTPGTDTGLVIDTIAPSAPVLTSLDSIADGLPPTILRLTDDGAGDNAIIVVADSTDGSIVASGPLGAPDASGVYAIELDAPLGVGAHHLIATVVDAAGNISAVSAALPVTIDTPPPPPPPPPTPPVVTVDGPEVSAVAAPTVTGTATAGASVVVTLDGAAFAPVLAGDDGKWKLTVSATPRAGHHDLTAQASNAGGRSSIVATTLTQQAPPASPDQAFAPVTTAALLAGHGTIQFDPGTQQVTLSDGTYNVSPDTDAAFAARLYLGALGRAPDAAGLAHWTGALSSGAGPVAIAQAFLSSSEGMAVLGSADNGTFVTDLYQTLLGRAPDPAAVAWVRALDGGTSRASILTSIASSDEAKGALAAKTTGLVVQDSNIAAITQAYQTAFGRAPDAPGEASWLSSLRGGLSPIQMVRDFAASAEFAGAHAAQDNGGFVASLWQSGLGRAPTGGELSFETNALASGYISRSDLLVQVATSAEGKGHLFGG